MLTHVLQRSDLRDGNVITFHLQMQNRTSDASRASQVISRFTLPSLAKAKVMDVAWIVNFSRRNQTPEPTLHGVLAEQSPHACNCRYSLRKLALHCGLWILLKTCGCSEQLDRGLAPLPLPSKRLVHKRKLQEGLDEEGKGGQWLWSQSEAVQWVSLLGCLSGFSEPRSAVGSAKLPSLNRSPEKITKSWVVKSATVGRLL